MDQSLLVTDDEVDVDLLDVEIERRPGLLGASHEPVDGHQVAVSGEDEVAGVEDVRSLERPVGVVPERVVLGGGDNVAVDAQVDERVVVDEQVQNLPGPSLTGLGIDREDLVTDLDLANGLGGAAGHDHFGLGGEAASKCCCSWGN